MQANVLLVTVTTTESMAVIEAFREATGRGPRLLPIGRKLYHDLGTVNRVRVLLVESEMGAGGLGAAQQTVQKGIEALSPSAIIMVGIAFGASAERQCIGDILVSQRILLYELQRVGTDKEGGLTLISRGDRPHASPWLFDRFRSADLYWVRPDGKPKVYFGLILSGEKLVDNVDFRQSLNRFEPEAIGGEMEGTGLYVACQDEKVDWILVKGICDWADGDNDKNRAENQRRAARNSASLVLRMLQQAPLTTDIQATHRRSVVPHRDPGEAIPPLGPPLISRSAPSAVTMSRIHIRQIVEGYTADDERRMFDITIANVSDVQLLLTTFDVTWRYHHGYLSSIDHGDFLVPMSAYLIQLPIDTDDESPKFRRDLIYPAIAMPPRNESGPSTVTVRLEMLYFLSGRLDYHPCADWNIIFSVAVLTDAGDDRCEIFSHCPWRVSEYEEARQLARFRRDRDY